MDKKQVKDKVKINWQIPKSIVREKLKNQYAKIKKSLYIIYDLVYHYEIVIFSLTPSTQTVTYV